MPSISCCRSASNYLQSSETWSGQLSVKLEALRSGNMVLGQTSILVIMFIFLNILKAQMGTRDIASIRINMVVFLNKNALTHQRTPRGPCASAVGYTCVHTAIMCVSLERQRIGTLAALLETIPHGNGDDRDPSSFLLRVYKNSEHGP